MGLALENTSKSFMMEKSYRNLDPGILFPALRLGIFRMKFRVIGQNRLRDYLGSAWRGVLGHALRKRFCLWPQKKNCRKCRSSQGCTYHFMFERVSELPGFHASPKPYVVRPWENASDQVGAELVLVGLDDEMTLQVLTAFLHIKTIGWARKESRIELESIYQMEPGGEWKEVYSSKGIAALSKTSWLLKDYLDEIVFRQPPWTVKTLTPLRLERQGTRLQKEIPWNWAFERFAWRLFLLDSPMDLDRRKGVLTGELPRFFSQTGRIVQVNYWQEVKRFSSTQKRKIHVGGLKGVSMIMPPEGKEHIWYRWWHSAALLHLGKKTTIGNGWITFNEHSGR